jgi:ribonuclease P protein component
MMDRRHSLSGTKTLEWFFANRKWVRSSRLTIVECCWALRPLPEGEPSVRFLVMAPKRSYSRAHDRNRIKRWLRAAVTETPAFLEIESTVQTQARQLLIMLRVSKPLAALSWHGIADDVLTVAVSLTKRIAQQS